MSNWPETQYLLNTTAYAINRTAITAITASVTSFTKNECMEVIFKGSLRGKW
jgi:hypothetical protein